MNKPLVAAVTAVLVSACAPSINPALKQSTDATIAAANGSHHEAAPASYAPQPWTVGQWIVFKVISKDTSPSVTRISVVAKGPEGIWVENDTQDYSHHTITKTLYSRMPMTPDESVDLMQKFVSKTDDQAPQVSDFGPAGGPAAQFTKNLMKALTPSFSFPRSVEGADKEDVTVAGGSFAGSAKYPTSFSFGPVKKDVTSWFHPAVPLNGGVKGVAPDGSFTYELLDYGQSGASSKLAEN